MGRHIQNKKTAAHAGRIPNLFVKLSWEFLSLHSLINTTWNKLLHNGTVTKPSFFCGELIFPASKPNRSQGRVHVKHCAPYSLISPTGDPFCSSLRRTYLLHQVPWQSADWRGEHSCLSWTMAKGTQSINSSLACIRFSSAI